MIGHGRCVWCGALALPGIDPGEVLWVVDMTMDPDCEHETLFPTSWRITDPSILRRDDGDR